MFEYECYTCGHEVETDESPVLPLRPCPECDDGKLHHVGPIVDECDECGAGLLYHGNSGLGRDTLCDGCYDSLRSVMS
jgi:uncharacterized protein (DUF983 family)